MEEDLSHCFPWPQSKEQQEYMASMARYQGFTNVACISISRAPNAYVLMWWVKQFKANTVAAGLKLSQRPGGCRS